MDIDTFQIHWPNAIGQIQLGKIRIDHRVLTTKVHQFIPPATADCELIGPGWSGQPINTATTLAFVVAAVVVYRRTSRLTMAAGLALTGIGSFLFHGPMPPGSEWTHDVSLAWLIALVCAAGTRFEKLAGWALLGLSALVLLAPAIADPIAVVLAVTAAIRLLRTPTSWILWGVGIIGAGALVGRLSATGGPWCHPESWLQGHGLWHIAAATGVAVIELGRHEAPGSYDCDRRRRSHCARVRTCVTEVSLRITALARRVIDRRDLR